MSEIELSGEETTVSNEAVPAAVENPTESTPIPAPEAAEVTASVPPAADVQPLPVLDQNEEKLKEAVRGFLNVKELNDFGDLIDKCSVQELTLLMEELAAIDLSRDNIRKVGKLKTRFDNLKESHYKDLKQRDADDPGAKELKEQVDGASKRFTAALAKFNQRKNDFETNEQKSREENTVKKRALVDKLMEIVQKDDFTAIEEVRKIQDEWKTLGPANQADNETLFQTYRTYSDQFYTQRQRYLDLLEQSRQVNLEQKKLLVKEAQNLLPEDLTSVSRNFWQETGDKLKVLHEQWRTIGPVPKKDSDVVWNEFKEASDKFYSEKRAFFKELDDVRAQNATQKREILQKLSDIAIAEYDSVETWRTSTEEVKVLRENWKKIGPAPSTENDEINKSFTDKINLYFDRRTAYFGELDKSNEDVLKRKEELLEKAEAIKDSDDWKKATDELVRLQREWVEAGDDSFKEARKLRKRFRKACDTFFRRKKDHVSTIQQSETENLKQKEELRDKLIAATEKQLADAGWASSEEGISAEMLSEIRDQFESVGRVPLKNKDSIQKDFNKAYDDYLVALFPDAKEREQFRLERSKNAGSRPLPSSSSPQRIEFEEKQNAKRIQSIKEKISQFENNFVFISQSKSSDSFRKEIEAKIAEARIELEKLEKRRDTLRDMRKAEKEKLHAEKAEKNKESETAPVSEPAAVTETVETEA